MNYCVVILAFFNLFTKQPPYQKFSDEIIERHRKEILVPRRLSYCVMGGGNDQGIKTIHLGVSTKGPGSIEEGRRLLVFLVEDLLNRYNTHQKIRPHLSNFPYTPNNLTYKIWYNGPKGGFWIIQDQQSPEKEIAHIAMYRGKIKYNINLSDKILPLKAVHTETYEEAKKIVMEEQHYSKQL